MPVRLEKSDRRLLMWAAAILLPIMVALAISSPSEEQDSGIPSTYSAQTSGAKAAYLLLQDLGYQVERWEQPPSELPVDAANTVLVLARPHHPPSQSEKNELQTYLSRGGKILATGATAENYLPQADSEREPLLSPIGKEYHPQLLTPLTRGGGIQMSPAAYWKKSSTAFLAHYSDDGRPIVVSYKVGKGEVIWWGGTTPLTNAAIGSSGNLALLLNSLGAAGSVHVYWDEYFHNDRRMAGSYFWGTPSIKYASWQCFAIFLVLLFTYSRRNGPIHPWTEPIRLSPLEFVHTLGNLYHRASATHSALEVPYTRFRVLATRQLGIKTDVPSADLARAVRSRLGYKDDSLDKLLQQIETALYDPGLNEARALELVQQLSVYMQNLKLIPLERQENISHAGNLPSARARTN